MVTAVHGPEEHKEPSDPTYRENVVLTIIPRSDLRRAWAVLILQRQSQIFAWWG